MSLKRNKNFGALIGGTNSPKKESQTKRVIDIILDIDHPRYGGPNSIGVIFFTDEESGEFTVDPYSLPIAKPISRNTILYPLKGELVQIIQTVSNDYYPDLDGNPKYVNNYYYPPINIHNNTTNNALPLIGRKRKRKNYNTTSEGTPNFDFQKEFISLDREIARKQVHNYLVDLGYTLGVRDSKSPKYDLFQSPNGNYIFRLEDSKDNEIKLGNYFKENQNQKSLKPIEGDLITEGRNGQRIRFTTTGPESKNIVSNNVTKVDDENTSIGDPALIISIGENENEDPNIDPASIYLLKNQSIPISVVCNNIESLKATFAEIKDPLEEISKDPPLIIPSNLGTELIDFENIATTELPPPAPPDTDNLEDPMFDNLNEVEEESELETPSQHFEDPREELMSPITPITNNNYPVTNAIANNLNIDSDEVATWDPKYTDKRIKTLHPSVRQPTKELILRCSNELDINLRVTNGFRTIAEQNALYAQGRGENSTGKVVTNAEGGESFHNYGLAFDLVEILDGEANWDYDHVSVSNIAKSLNFEWGGDWKSFKDKPHYQMPFGYKTNALKSQLDSDLGSNTALENIYPNLT